MSCIQSKVCSTAQELTGSQHSSWNIVHKLFPQPALRNCKEAASLLILGMLQMSVHSWSIFSERETYDMLSFIPIWCTIMHVFFQVINALQKPTPNWTNLRRNVRNFSKLSEMSQKFNDSEVGWYIYDKSRKDRLRHKIWVAKSPPELPAVSTDHETLCTSSFSPHAQPRRNLVDFECSCAHGELCIIYTIISWQWHKIWITHHNWWNNG